jgi:hypothetical protein
MTPRLSFLVLGSVLRTSFVVYKGLIVSFHEREVKEPLDHTYWKSRAL